MFQFKKENKSTNSGSIGTAHNSIVAGTTIVGNVSSKTDIRIDGKLEGNLKSEAKVVVGKNALIIGEITCLSILIEGKVEGNINASEKIHIQRSGIIEGNLSTNKLIIEDGAVFNGASLMKKGATISQNNGNQAKRNKRKEIQEAS